MCQAAYFQHFNKNYHHTFTFITKISKQIYHYSQTVAKLNAKNLQRHMDMASSVDSQAPVISRMRDEHIITSSASSMSRRSQTSPFMRYSYTEKGGSSEKISF